MSLDEIFQKKYFFRRGRNWKGRKPSWSPSGYLQVIKREGIITSVNFLPEVCS